MRTIFLAAILAAATAPANASLYKLSLPDQVRTDIVGVRDLHNGQWLAGVEIDTLWLRRKDENKPIAYLALNHLYNADEKGRGSLGAALGLHTGKAGETIVKALGILAPDQVKRFQWIEKISDYATLEVAGGYRVFGTPPGVSAWVYGIGGKVRIPLGRVIK